MMAIIDREKALRNLAFGQQHTFHVPVTTLHVDGSLTSGDNASAATTAGVHDLPLERALGVSTIGLKGLLSSMREDTPRVEVQGGTLVFSGKRSSYALSLCSPSMKAAPERLDSTEEIAVDGGSQQRNILKSLPVFAGNDIGRPHLHSVFFNSDGFSSLDGLRIAKWGAGLDKVQAVHAMHEKQVLLALKNFDEGFRIVFGDEHVLLYDDETRWLVAQAKDAKDYSNMIPDPTKDSTISMPFTQELIDAIRAVSNAVESDEVYLDFQDDDLEVTARGSTGATAKEVLSVSSNGEALRMKFRAKMLIDALKAGLDLSGDPKLHMMAERRCSQVTAGSGSFTTMAMSI